METLTAIAPLLGAFGSLLGHGGSSSSQSTATNTTTLAFNPVVVAGGNATPTTSGSASSSVTPSESNTPSQPQGLSFPFVTNPAAPIGANGLGTIAGLGATPATGITGSLSSTDLLLLGGLLLLLVMSMSRPHHGR